MSLAASPLKIPPVREEYRGTVEQQMACTPDVWRLCFDQIPDVSRITACLQQNTPQLSKRCRAVFESNASMPASNRCPPRLPKGRADRAKPLRRPIGQNAQLRVIWQTSTHSAPVSSAIRIGVMRTALWVEPAAGTTSSNALQRDVAIDRQRRFQAERTDAADFMAGDVGDFVEAEHLRLAAELRLDLLVVHAARCRPRRSAPRGRRSATKASLQSAPARRHRLRPPASRWRNSGSIRSRRYRGLFRRKTRGRIQDS